MTGSKHGMHPREIADRMNLTLLAHIGLVAVAAGSMAGPVRADEPRTAGNPPVHREELGSLPKGFKVGTLRLSPDGKHFAGVIVRGDRWTVYVDGVESSEYDAVTEDSIHFSPDSKRVAYGTTRDGKGFAVVDGKEFTSGLACASGFPVFSATSEHFLYVAAQSENRASVVVDGKEGETWEALMKGGTVFGPDGSRFVYVVKEGRGGRAVVDGVAGPVYENVIAPIFGPEGKHLAYVALTPNDSILVVDGKKIVRTDNFVRDSLGFDSPTRLHILSIDNRGKIARLQLDLSKSTSRDVP